MGCYFLFERKIEDSRKRQMEKSARDYVVLMTQSKYSERVRREGLKRRVPIYELCRKEKCKGVPALKQMPKRLIGELKT